MRYDTVVKLYDSKLRHVDTVLCNKSDMGTRFAMQNFGDAKLERLIIRLNTPLPFRTGYFEIGEKAYKTIKPVNMDDRFTHYVEEYKAGINHGV